MHVEVVLAALVLVVAVLVAADFFRRTNDGPPEYAEGQAHDAGRETSPGPRAGSALSVSSLARPNWLVRTRLCLLAVVSAAAAVLATGGFIRAAGAFQRASAHSHVSSMHDGAVVSAVLALVFAVAVLAAGLCSAMILIRSVLRPLYQLRAGAVELAEVWLPDTLRDISQAGGEARPGAVKAVGASALDEIGDIAHAFDQVQGEVLRLAGSEAGLRGKLSEMFTELSGRGQSLMDHQLRLIDELGQDEHDATRRASLVTMNRLAARMRRYSQNLLVLAGQELPGQWDRPVMLANVIRAAAARTGERERVSVSVQPDIAISGSAVSDVVHLVSELAENAASLSATDTPVGVSGGALATGGVLVEVTDQGVGMNPEMMAKANWRLEHPPPLDVAVSRNMGLFVVGRLAARHGIKVRLQPAASGGLTALVWLPDPIIAPPEAGAPAGLARAEPEAQARHARSAGDPRAAWRLRALAPSRAPAGNDAGAISGPEAGPAEDPADGRRLPIYDAVESDWFSRRSQPSGGAAAAAAGGWAARADSGWDAARTVLAPASSGVTTAGLPVRAPRANLVPGAFGSPSWPDASGPVRSADAARNRLAGFQRGASRGRAASGHDGQDPAP
jgi:signal transduction histidine kinase